MAGAGELTIRTCTTLLEPSELRRLSKPRKDPHFVCLSVCDTGPGMEDAVAARAFDPFFTTKHLGTGLGLSVVHGVIGQHGGLLRVLTAPGEGCKIEMCLPRTSLRPSAAPERPKATHAGAKKAGLVLLVEDEAALREWLTNLLGSAGFDVLAAADGNEALERADHLQAPPYCVVSDVRMPGLSGPELAFRLRARWPKLPLLLMTGYAPEAALAALPKDASLLLKPFTGQALLDALSNVAEPEPQEE